MRQITPVYANIWANVFDNSHIGPKMFCVRRLCIHHFLLHMRPNVIAVTFCLVIDNGYIGHGVINHKKSNLSYLFLVYFWLQNHGRP